MKQEPLMSLESLHNSYFNKQSTPNNETDLQKFKDEQAKSVGYADWDALWEQIIKDKDWDSAEWNMDKVAKALSNSAYYEGVNDATKEASIEIQKNYQPITW